MIVATVTPDGGQGRHLRSRLFSDVGQTNGAEAGVNLVERGLVVQVDVLELGGLVEPQGYARIVRRRHGNQLPYRLRYSSTAADSMTEPLMGGRGLLTLTRTPATAGCWMNTLSTIFVAAASSRLYGSPSITS